MGIIGDAFKKLFGLLWEVIKWIGNLLYKLFKPVIDVFMKVVEVIFALIDAFLYFLYSIGLVVTKLFILQLVLVVLESILQLFLSNTLDQLH